MSKDILNDNSFAKINVSSEECIKNFINDFLLEEKNGVFNLFGEDKQVIFNKIEQYFISIKAAGGLVANKNDELLVIKRLGFYDFPKGKIEKGETPEQGAVREVSEECGINENDLKIDRFIKSTFHIYPLNGSYALKETLWYAMSFKANYNLKPQIEEDITEIKWIDKSDIREIFKNSYPSLSDLIDS